MKATRLKIYHNNRFIGEEIYLLHTQTDAIVRCRKRHPEYKDDVIICAEDYDTEKNKEHFHACRECGVVFFFNTTY